VTQGVQTAPPRRTDRADRHVQDGGDLVVGRSRLRGQQPKETLASFTQGGECSPKCGVAIPSLDPEIRAAGMIGKLVEVVRRRDSAASGEEPQGFAPRRRPEPGPKPIRILDRGEVLDESQPSGLDDIGCIGI
jgi:hypothetical protein